VNALADLLQKQRVRSLEATALLARILEVMHAPLFAFDREDTLQLVNNAGSIAGTAEARAALAALRERTGLEELLPRPTNPFTPFHENRANPRGGCCARRPSARKARRTRCCCWPT
jgi:hypothetical protein